MRLFEFIPVLMGVILGQFGRLVEEHLQSESSRTMSAFNVFCLNLIAHETCQLKKCYKTLLTVSLEKMFADSVDYAARVERSRHQIVFNYFALHLLREKIFFSEKIRFDGDYKEYLNCMLNLKTWKFEKVCALIGEILQIVYN